MIPKLRLDALTDGLFGVAMTLLVIDLRLPDSFHPKDAAELLHRLGELWNQGLVYVISFYVLGIRWLGLVKLAPRGERVSERFVRWALVHLLFITLVPFATMIVGRYPNLAPAIWIYAGNTILVALAAVRLTMLAGSELGHAGMAERRFSLMVLIVVSLLTIAASFFDPRHAMVLYVLNFADAPLRRILLPQRSEEPTIR
jgi:uncharacterized membrane protein